MAERLLVETRLGETRVALMENGVLNEFSVEREAGGGDVGNIYLGRVENVLPGMQAAFIDIGEDKNAFLAADDFAFASSDFGTDAERVKARVSGQPIEKRLKRGQETLVQIVKVPGGSKGARVTGYVTLPGRLVVLLPTVDFIGISRRIASEEERARLRSLASRVCPEGMGMIVRTAAEGADEDALAEDVGALKRDWDEIAKRAACVKAPRLLTRDHDLVYRAIRDALGRGVDEVVFEDEAAFEKGRAALQQLAPDGNVRAVLDAGARPLFLRAQVQSQLEKALERRVWLKSGGYLVIDRTEALTVIDVNTGKFVGKADFEETAFKLNAEAAAEIAHQLRLRDIGGIIIIDFIDMKDAKAGEALLQILRDALKADRAHTNVVGMTGLGLVEMTRKRRREPPETYYLSPCPVCGASGKVHSPEACAEDALTDAQWRLSSGSEGCVLLTVSRRVYQAIFKTKRALSGVAYAISDDGLNDTEYRIAPARTDVPPKGARRIGEEEHE